MKAVNPKDIRLGNWLKHSPNADWAEDVHNKPVQVDIHTLLEIDGTYRYKDIQELYLPIEISPEILEKAGFHDMDGICILRLNDVLVLMSTRDGLVYAHYLANGYNICLTDIPVKHLHQLQNLYFALTSSELPINL